MNNAAPENTAALQEKIAELEQQLKLSDEGASHLAERCLSLEQKVQSYLAAHPQREMHTDSPTLLQPLLYYDAGFGFSEKDTLTAPDCTTDARASPECAKDDRRSGRSKTMVMVESAMLPDR